MSLDPHLLIYRYRYMPSCLGHTLRMRWLYMRKMLRQRPHHGRSNTDRRCELCPVHATCMRVLLQCFHHAARVHAGTWRSFFHCDVPHACVMRLSAMHAPCTLFTLRMPLAVAVMQQHNKQQQRVSAVYAAIATCHCGTIATPIRVLALAPR